MFEKFIRVVRPDCPWTQEEASIQILQKIVDEQRDMFQKYELDEQDITFIKVGPTFTFYKHYYTNHFQEIIYGPLDGSSVSPDQPWPYEGRDVTKAFLFEVVANKSCSIDVDKVCIEKSV